MDCYNIMMNEEVMMKDEQNQKWTINSGKPIASTKTFFYINLVLCIVFAIVTKYLRAHGDELAPGHIGPVKYTTNPIALVGLASFWWFALSFFFAEKHFPVRNIADKFIKFMYLYLSVIPFLVLIAKGNYGSFLKNSTLFLLLFILLSFIAERNPRY